MKNKYYTPEIEEFHVGFEYEFKWSVDEDKQENWYRSDIKDFQQFIDIYHPIYSLRVKLLDREDIEELGFEHDSTVEQECFYKHKSTNFMSENDWWLIYYEKTGFITIHDSNGNSDNEFYGEIKNKSELRRLMKQLHI